MLILRNFSSLKIFFVACALAGLLAIPQLGHATVLEDLTDNLTVGTWSQISNNSLSGLTLQESNFYFGNTAVWDGDSNRLLWMGGPGGCCSNDPNYSLVIYNESNNTWTEQGTPYTTSGHAYDGNAYFGGNFYFALYGQRDVKRWNGSSWSSLPNLPWSSVSVAAGLTYFPEANGLVYVNEVGRLAIYQNGSWNVISGGTWGSIHTFGEYNPVHGVVWLGAGNGNSNRNYRLNADLTLTRMTDSPFSMNVPNAIQVVDPNSGLYLVLNRSNNTWWEFDIINDTWTQINNMVNQPSGDSTLIAATLPEHGAIILIRGDNKTAFLYKHTAGGGADPTPSVSLSALPATIDSGDDVTLSWSVSDADSCVASGNWSGNKNASGGSETDTNVNQNSTYTLTCTGPGGSGSDSASVAIAAPTVNLIASPSNISSGDDVTLSWSVTGATSCTASGDWSGSKNTNGGSETDNNVTQNSSYTLTCTGPGGSANDSAFASIGGDGTADWLTRSTGPGVLYANNFDTQSAVTNNVLPDNQQNQVTWDQTLKKSGGGALRFEILNTNGTNFGNWYTCWSDPCDNLEAGEEIYIQFRQYTPEYLVNHEWEHTGSSRTHFKQLIVSRGSSPGSNTPYEVVLTSDNVGWPIGYWQDGQVTARLFQDNASTGCSNFSPTDFRMQNVVDRGVNPLSGLSPDGDAWTNCEQARAQYGGLYSAFRNPHNVPTTPTDPLSGAWKYPLNDWATYMVRIKLGPGGLGSNGNLLEVYTAHEGEDFELIMQETNATLGSEYANGEGMNGFWLLPYISRGIPNPSRQNTFTVYDEVIVSSNYIPAPQATPSGPVERPIVELVTSVSDVLPGSRTILDWNTSHVTTCTASGGWSGTFSGIGSMILGPILSNSLFGLSCTGPGGSASDSVNITAN